MSLRAAALAGIATHFISAPNQAIAIEFVQPENFNITCTYGDGSYQDLRITPSRSEATVLRASGGKVDNGYIILLGDKIEIHFPNFKTSYSIGASRKEIQTGSVESIRIDLRSGNAEVLRHGHTVSMGFCEGIPNLSEFYTRWR